MTGHTFHREREELHGITVVLAGRSGRTYVGRYHERGSRGVIMHDAAIHDPETADADRDAWLDRMRKFGVKVTEKMLIIPDDEAGDIEKFG